MEPNLRIDHSRRRHSYGRVDIDATVEVGGQEGHVQPPRRNNGTGFGIKFINIILRSRKENILNSIVQGIDKGLGEDLFGFSSIIARECGLP